MSFLRWTPSFLGFPLGGWLAFQILGPVRDPLTAFSAGIVAGGIIGTVQWLALRPTAGWRWIAATAIGMASGSTLAAILTGSSTSVGSLTVSGLIAGALVGAAQGIAMLRGWRTAMLWTMTISAAWALGWAITASVIVVAHNGYVAFGASGASAVTVITGVVLRHVLGRRNPLAAFPAATAGVGAATGDQL
jgi:hypothetical protein